MRGRGAKASSTPGVLVSIFAAVLFVAVGFYGEVRAQSGSAPAKPVIPLRPLGALSSVKVPPVFGIEGIVADQAAAVQLGKALFWDMQAGSDENQACATCHFNAGADSRAVNQVNPGQAGGDNSFQLGGPNLRYRAGTPLAGFGGYHDGDFPFHKLADPGNRFSAATDVNDVSGSQGVYSRTMGQVRTQGKVDVETSTEVPDAVFSVPDPNRPGAALNTRQVTGRNTPSNINAVFNYRNFWDGRAQNVCNGVNPFGARDKHAHLMVFDAAKNDVAPAVVGMPNSSLCSQALGPILSSVEMSAANRNFRDVGRKLLSRKPLALQHVDRTDSVLGNLVSQDRGLNVSYAALIQKAFLPEWWQFSDVLCVAGDGSVSSPVQQLRRVVTRVASESEETRRGGRSSTQVVVEKGVRACPSGTQPYSQMEYNFSLFWGVAVQAYESTLIADQTPFDKYMEQQLSYVIPGTGGGESSGGGGRGGRGNEGVGDPGTATDPSGGSGSGRGGSGSGGSGSGNCGGIVSGGSGNSGGGCGNGGRGPDVGVDLGGGGGSGSGGNGGGHKGPDTSEWRNSYTIQLTPGIAPHTISVISLNPDLDFSDQDIFAFDDGYGRFIGKGADGTIHYDTGVVVLNFEAPPGAPVTIKYSVGPTPLTEGQLRGLVVFQTKGRCIVCHGGPEFSNASVDTVSAVPLERMFMGDFNVRVYDTGFYHIGVRTGAEDAGLAGSDPVAAMPLSLAEELQQRVCKDPAQVFMIPGRPGDGITQSPLRCRDEIARTGFFKTPQLRNIALTAPYFHNGSQLTLEQVVEFYNRGGDFNILSELSIMDPDVEDAGLRLTLQEQKDLVDFLRNALTDARTVKQAAPFDHPQLFLAYGHASGPQGLPESDPSDPGQAMTQFMEIPAVGAQGGKPLATFLENMLAPPATATATAPQVAAPPRPALPPVWERPELDPERPAPRDLPARKVPRETD